MTKTPQILFHTTIRATFIKPDGTIDHSYTFNIDDKDSRVRFAIECKHAYRRKGAKVLTEAI